MFSEIKTYSGDLSRVRATSATDTSFASKVPTATEPTGAGVLDLATAPGVLHNCILLLPFGGTDNDDTFDMRVLGWRKAVGGSTVVWVPMPLLEVSCTISSTADGVAGGNLSDIDFLADTITAAAAYTDYAGVSYQILSPANNTPGHIFVDLKGCRKVEVIFDLTGTGNAANALYGTL